MRKCLRELLAALVALSSVASGCSGDEVNSDQLSATAGSNSVNGGLGMMPATAAGPSSMDQGGATPMGPVGTTPMGPVGTTPMGPVGTTPMGPVGTTPMGSVGATPETGDMAQDAGVMTDAGTDPDPGTAIQDSGVPAATSAFPTVAIDDLTSPGSFTAETTTSTGPGGGYNVYYPEELGRDGLKHPVLTWGNGATTTPDQYTLLPNLASQGFVVIAARSSFVSGTMLRDGLDWMLEQNTVAGSEFEGMLDTEKVASFGYSLGSLATFEIGTDPRLTTTVHISGGIMGSGDESQATAVDVPTAYFCDKDETGPNCDSDFAAVDDNPTFYGRVPGAVHVDYMFNRTFIDRMNAAVTGWLRWKLLDDQTMAAMFEGADCVLCTDSAWEVQKKNMD